MARAVAEYTFQAAQQGDLSFMKGENILVLDQNPSGWWLGQTDDNRQGIFPFNRVRLLQTIPMRQPAPQPILDRINQVDVRVVEPVPEFGQEFLIRVVLSNNQVIETKRKMEQFRVYNDSLNRVSGAIQSGIGPFPKTQPDERLEIPEWADSMLFGANYKSSKSHERAEILQSFLRLNIGAPQLDYLLVCWLNPGAVFSYPDHDKRNISQVLTAAQTQRSQQAANNRVRDPELAKAQYVWPPQNEEELPLQRGEIVAVLRKETEYAGWWLAQKVNGGIGLLPYNYVLVLSVGEASERLHPKPQIARQASQPKAPVTMFANKISVGNGTNKFRPGSTRFDHKAVADLVDAKKAPRYRKKVAKYCLCSNEAFDELLQHGLTVEENGKIAKFLGSSGTPKKGDQVTLDYSGYIWEPQKQELLEFASSDVLTSTEVKDPHQPGEPKPVQQEKEQPLQFKLGLGEAIDGIEETVAKMKEGQAVRVTLTPDKAYGMVGYPPDIPGNAYLVYDLKLKRIDRNSTNQVSHAEGVKRGLVAQRNPGNGPSKFMGAASTRVIQSQRNLGNSTKGPQTFGGAPDVPLGASPNQFKKQLSLAKLQDIVRKNEQAQYGINPAVIEDYLTEEEFTKAFNVDRFTWLLMPAFKRKQMKQQVGLF